MGRSPFNRLVVCGVLLLCLACIQYWHPAVAASAKAGHHRHHCQAAKYPLAKLSTACTPTPRWCARLRGHGGRQWRKCRRPACQSSLRFGERNYPVGWTGWKASKGRRGRHRLPMFRLAVAGWRRRRLTIWHGRLYARSGRSWKLVWQVGDGQLVARDPKARPPCATKAGKAKKGKKRKKKKAGAKKGTKARGLRASCHGNRCTVRLSLRRLIRQARRLLRRHRRRRRRRRHRRQKSVELRLVLALRRRKSAKGARFASGQLVLVDDAKARRGGRRRGRGRGRGRRDRGGDDSARKYRRFLDERRQRYWRKEGRDADGKKRARNQKRRRRNGRKAARRGHLATPQQRSRGGSRSRDGGNGGEFKPLSMGGFGEPQNP